MLSQRIDIQRDPAHIDCNGHMKSTQFHRDAKADGGAVTILTPDTNDKVPVPAVDLQTMGHVTPTHSTLDLLSLSLPFGGIRLAVNW